MRFSLENDLGDTGLEQFRKSLGIHRFTEIVSLSLVAQVGLQKFQLLESFNTLGDDPLVMWL
jgi:hypothetical protein